MLSNNSFSQSNPDVMQTFKCLLIFSINHEDIFYCLCMDDDQYNTMLVFLIIFLAWMKTNLAQAKVMQTIHPFVAIKTKKRKKEKQSKRKENFTPKRKSWRTNDLDWNQDKEVCRPLMTFTRVFIQLKRREKRCMGFEFHSTGKNSMRMAKKATRSN